MIKIENVSKTFTTVNKNRKKNKLLAVNNISFVIPDGKIIGILGPNGAGKTTLLRMISGIMIPTYGTITIDNMNYISDDINIKRQIAYLSGNTKLYNTISPYELLTMCGDFYNINKNEVNESIKEISKILNMESFINTPIAKLSTGQTQKVNIARCLIHNPKYYILDEATSGLDIISSQIILDFIKKEKNNGKTIIYSTHYMEEAENICDYVIMINKGEIISTGTTDEINEMTNTTNLRDAFFALIKGETYEK